MRDEGAAGAVKWGSFNTAPPRFNFERKSLHPTSGAPRALFRACHFCYCVGGAAAVPEEGPLGTVEHLKTLCCLGLPPEAAMVAVTPLLHEIIPHQWSCTGLLEPDATIGRGYSENPASAAIFRERLWRFLDDSSSPWSLWMPSFRAKGIGWTLHMQGGDWLARGWYREIEAPLDSCWILDAMIGDAGQSFVLANLKLTRPRGARPFTADDVQRLDRLRPWLAHAFRRPRQAARPRGIRISWAWRERRC